MTILRRILTASTVVIVLASVPSHLAAQDRGSSKEAQSSVLAWFSGLWSDLARLFAGEDVPLPPRPEPPLPAGQSDNGCAVDPHGGCGG